MSPPPPRPDDTPPPPEPRWEVVEPPRDPLLDDPLFAEIVEPKPLPDLRVEPPALPVAEPIDELPVAEVVPAAPPRPRPRPVPPPPPPRLVEQETEIPRPNVISACAVIGCFGLGFLGAVAFMAWASLTLLTGLNNSRPDGVVVASSAPPGPVLPTSYPGDNGQLNLQGTVDGVGRAAGGRYLLLRASRTGTVHAFDPNVGAVTKRFDIGTGRALFAGSAAKLFAYRPLTEGGGSLERWDLETQQLELSVKRPNEGVQPTALAVGAGADGPVYLVSAPTEGKASVRVLDPDTLDEKATHALPGWIGTDFTHVRAADDGATLAVTTKVGAQLLRFPTPKAVPTLTLLPGGGGRAVPRYATPAPNGRLVYSPSGLYTADAVPQPGPNVLPFPAAHGADLFVSQGRQRGLKLTPEIRLHLTAVPDESVVLDDVVGPSGLELSDVSAVTPDQRVHVWPAAGLAAVVTPGTPSQVMFSKVNVSAALQSLENPYLVVGSDPPAWATRRSEWRYAPTVWTNAQGAPQVTLLDAPPGMTVRGNGEVVWTPDANAARAVPVRVRVTVGDRTTEQRFRVSVLDAPAGDDD